MILQTYKPQSFASRVPRVGGGDPLPTSIFLIKEFSVPRVGGGDPQIGRLVIKFELCSPRRQG